MIATIHIEEGCIAEEGLSGTKKGMSQEGIPGLGLEHGLAWPERLQGRKARSATACLRFQLQIAAMRSGAVDKLGRQISIECLSWHSRACTYTPAYGTLQYSKL
jgi:hypothetical protein